MSELPDDKDKLMHHNFDGIQELDNDLPSWWVSLFYVCIAFSIVYMGYYHGYKDGNMMETEYKAEVAKLEQKRADILKNYEQLPEAEKQAFLASKGTSLYQKNCSICHGNNAEGTVGPNLTDSFAIHAYDKAGLEKVIRNGVLAKGMPEWSSKMSDFEIKSVTAYINSLIGTNVPGKAKQGFDISKGAESYNAEKLALEKEQAAKEARLLAEAEAAKKSGVKILTEAEKLAAMPVAEQKAYLLKIGQAQFVNCVACHGAQGQGTIGPNLTDNFLKHGTTKEDMLRVIKKGIPGTAMAAWEAQLGEVKSKALAEYVWSLKGKNVKGKAAEGKEVK